MSFDSNDGIWSFSTMTNRGIRKLQGYGPLTESWSVRIAPEGG